MASLMAMLLAASLVAPTKTANGTTLPFQRHVVRVGPSGAGNGTYAAAVQENGANGLGLVLMRSADGGSSWVQDQVLQGDPTVRDTADLLADTDGAGFSLVYGVEPQSLDYTADSRFDIVFLHETLTATGTFFVDLGPVTVAAPGPNEGWFRPAITRDSLGVLHLTASLLHADGSFEWDVFTSTDDGATWGNEEELASHPSTIIGGRVDAQGSTVVAIFDARDPSTPGRYRVRPAGSTTGQWGPTIAFAPEGLYHAGAFSVTVGTDGILHLGYSDKDTEALRYRSFDGSTWSSSMIIESTGWWANQPALSHMGADIVYSWNHMDNSNWMTMEYLRKINGVWDASPTVVDNVQVFKGYTSAIDEVPSGEPLQLLWSQDSPTGGTPEIVAAQPYTWPNSPPPPPPPPPSGGPAGWWKFDEGTGSTAFDSSGNGNDCTLYGTSWVQGHSGDAISLPNSGYGECGSSSTLAITGELTVAAWIRVANPSQHAYMRIASKKNAWDDPNGYALSFNPGKHRLEILGSGSQSGSAAVTLDSGWHHVAGTISGGTAHLYVDGVDRTSISTVAPLVAGSTPLFIGRDGSGASQFNGVIDDLRIYPRALSASEIATLAGTAPSPGVVTANDISVTTTAGMPVGITLSGSDTDGDVVSYLVTSNPANGSLSGTAPNLVYSPDSGFTGTDGFTYQVSDGNGDSASATVTITVNAASSNPSAGLVGEWQFDEGSGSTTADSSGYGDNGALESATWTSGKFGDALFFDGVHSYVGVGTSAALEVTSGVSVCAWIKLANPSANAYMRIASKKDVWNSTAGYALSFNPGKHLVEMLGSGTTSASASGVALDGNWHHLCGTIDGGIGHLYVDGTDVTTSSAVTPLAADSTPLEIGRDPGGSSPFYGTIDAVRIYNRALSASEVQTLASGSAP